MIRNCSKCGIELDILSVTCSHCPKNKAILLRMEDWEMLYVNGELIKEGHTLNEGKPRIRFFIDLAKKYDFTLEKMKEIYIEEDDEKEIIEKGYSSQFLTEYKHNYERYN